MCSDCSNSRELEQLRVENEQLVALQAQLLASNSALKAEKESWGNEYTAVMLLKERVENLEQQLDFAIQVAQMRGAAACDGVERIKELETEIQTFADAWNELETLQALLREARVSVHAMHCEFEGEEEANLLKRIDAALGEK